MPNLALSIPTLPGGVPYCPSSANPYQQLINDAFGAAVAILPVSMTGVWVGDTPPTDTVTFRVWARTVTGGLISPVPFNPYLWLYTGGHWLSPHRVPAGTNDVRIWTGSLANLYLYDGGDGSDPSVTPPSLTTGSFWQVDTTFDALMPIGVGSLASGTAITVGGTGGEEKHTLIVAEMPAHSHGIGFNIQTAGGDAGGNPGGSNDRTSLPTGGDQPHNNMPPYVGVYFIKRTVRAYYIY